MAQLFSDAARAELATTIDSDSTTIPIVHAAANFPVATVGDRDISEGDWFKVVFQDLDGIEIAYVRHHDGSNSEFTHVLRGQEGTTARVFAEGSIVGLRQTATNAAVWEGKADADALADLTEEVREEMVPALNNLVGQLYYEVAEDTTVKSGDDVGVNASGGAINITLPESPKVGDRIVLTDIANTWVGDNTPTLIRNGNLIMGLDEDVLLNMQGVRIALIFTEDLGWKLF